MRDACGAGAAYAVPVSGGKTVARPRLMAAMDEPIERSVTLVCAPAGYGKTTLVASWLRRRRLDAAWVDCAEFRDGDAARFWAAVAAAVGSCAPDAPESEDGFVRLDGRLGGCSRDDAVAVVRAIEGRVFLVFDDYQEIPCESSIHGDMARFFALAPGALHVMVVSRSFPRIGLSKLRMDGALSELRRDALAFTSLEARELFAQQGIDLSKSELAETLERTRGWLAALKLEAKARTDGLSPEAAARLLYDYLVEEVLAPAPEDVRSFLVASSHMGGFCVSLATFALQADAGAVTRCVAALSDEGFFVSEEAGAAGEVWYAYHPLLASVLSTYALCDSGLSRKEVLDRASSWCEDNGLIEQAFRYASAACDWNRVASLVMRHWRTLHAADEIVLLHRWIEKVPDGYAEKHPGLCIMDAVPLALLGKREQAFSRLRVAKANLREGKGDAMEALYYVMRCLTASVLGEIDDALESAQRALALLPEEESYLRAMTEQVLGGSLAFDDPPAAIEAFYRAQEEQGKIGHISPLCSAYSNLASMCASVGRYNEAVMWADRAKALYPEVEHGSKPMLGFAYLAGSAAAYARDDIAEAQRQARCVRSHIDQMHTQDTEARMLLIDALVCRFSGSADEEIRLACEAFDSSPLCMVRTVLPFSCMKDWIEEGVLDECRIEEAFDGCAEHSPFRRAAKASLRLVKGEVDERLYDECITLARESEKTPLIAVRALEVASLVAEGAGRSRDADAALEKAFDIAEKEQMVRVFIDDEEILSQVWKRVARTKRSSFAAAVLKIASSRSALKSGEEAAMLLTDRELDVIRLAADGLSVQQIADRLFVSRETVKKHLSNIYGKLGVHAKMQAVAVLRRMGVL